MILRGHRQKSVSISTGIFLCKTVIKIGKMNITPKIDLKIEYIFCRIYFFIPFGLINPLSVKVVKKTKSPLKADTTL